MREGLLKGSGPVKAFFRETLSIFGIKTETALRVKDHKLFDPAACSGRVLVIQRNAMAVPKMLAEREKWALDDATILFVKDFLGQ